MTGEKQIIMHAGKASKKEFIFTQREHSRTTNAISIIFKVAYPCI